ncbi:G-protein coupled receptor 84 [Dunckerocampus dactyliophorus]|uniref:G-protein coupled receptor 84 n=1 Tax=Dunckerocampus dactyliophorus TaxID=161453 RepID=UPI0024068EA8|nr:G-protein coupled receptor 84 [Dunckerocampus dactyliophorus]
MLLNLTNQTETEDGFSCFSPSVEAYRYFAVLWGCCVTVTGTVGNLMTVLAFVSDSQLRTRFNVLIVNLAVADLLYCTVLQPISVDSYLHLRWRSGELWCRTFGLLLFLSNSVSIITLCLVAVSRYLLVDKRAVFDRVFSNRGLIFLLMATWALGLSSFLPLWSVYVFVPQVCTCSFHRVRGRPYTTILLFSYFFLGLGCVGTFYLLIYRRIRVASKALLRYRLSRRSSKRNAPPAPETDDSGVESSMPTCSSELSSHGDSSVQKSQHKPTEQLKANKPNPDVVIKAPASPPAPTTAGSGEDSEFKRVTRMCFAVFLCFVFCFVPFLILNIVDKRGSAPQVLHMLCANLTWLNSCINPILYAVMNRQFRKAYHVLLTKAASPLACLWVKSS